MNWYIYIIQNKINYKLYVGKSNNVNTRWKTHKKVSLGGKKKYPNDFFIIHGALSKYGIDNFNFQIIEEFNDEKECLQAEEFWIQFFRSWDRSYGYNLTFGGDGESPTLETRLRMSKAQRGDKNPQAILNDQLVIEILNKYNTGDYNQRQLAKEYNIHYATINDLIRNKTWKHIVRLPLLSKNIHSDKQKELFIRNGEKTGNNKLTEENVKEVIKLYNNEQYTYKQIAKMFNIKTPTIYAIINGITWKHITRDINGI